MVVPGSICEIRGLQSRPELNGHRALVLSYAQERQRFAIEDVSSGERMMAKEANLVTRDVVLKLHKGALGDMQLCHEYTAQLFKLACNGGPEQMMRWGDNEGISLDAVSGHQLIILELNAVAHQCALEVLRTPAGLRGRLLHCWVKNGLRGFTAREWLQRDESARWMEEDELKNWCARLLQLRWLVQDLTNDHLLRCARAKGRHEQFAQSMWAADTVAGIPSRPLTQAPGSLDYVDEDSVDADGSPSRFMVLAGWDTASPELLLDFPVKLGVPILRLSRELFSCDFSAFTWFKAIEFHNHHAGWQIGIEDIVGE